MENIRPIIKTFFNKVFDIREGEMQRALLMQFNIFLIISTLLIVKPTINALFLAKFGVEQLPIAFILVAGVAAIISILYSRLLTRISLKKLSLNTFGFSIISLLAFGVFLRFNIFENVILYLFYIWVAIFALLTTSQFWVLANIVFNPREAKRLFGFVGAGAIAGGIFGGYLTSILAESIGSENLPFVCAGLLAICIPVTKQVWKKNVADVTPQFERKRRIRKDSVRPLQLIKTSKHLTYIACLVGVSVMVAKLVDYQFGGIASRLIPDPDELTAFFGFWFSTFNVISLFLQLFLTRKVVGTFGVGVSLFFLPGIILFAAILLLIFPSLLMAAVFLKMADGSLKQSINKASMELVIMPISKEIKNQTKTFIDVFVDSLATGIIGLLLIFVIKGLDLSMAAVSWMILGLLILWIYFANQIRKEYLKTFRIKLKELAPKSKLSKKVSSSIESVLGGWRRVLETGEESQILFVLKKLKETPDERMFLSIKNLLSHSSDDIKALALENLYFLKHQNLSKEIRNYISHPSQKVKIAAFEYLLLKDPADELELMQQYITDSDQRVSGAALISLAKETRSNPDFRLRLDLDQKIEKSIQLIDQLHNPGEIRILKTSLLKAIGHGNWASYYYVIRQHLYDPDPEIAKEAIEATGLTLSTFFLNDLLKLLNEKTTKTYAEDALVQFKSGLIPILQQKINQSEIKTELLRRIPAVVKRIPSQHAANFLMGLLDHEDGVIRLEALRGLNTLRINCSHLDFNPKGIAKRVLLETNLYQNTLSVLHSQIKLESVSESINQARNSLIQLLEKRLNRNLERIFRLLGLKYPPDDIFHIYRGLISEKSDLSINAIEFLDNLLEPNIKKVLIPIVETSMLETISEEAIKRLKLKVPTEAECFQLLLEGKDNRIKIAVLFLIGQLKNKTYIKLINPLLDHPDEKLRSYAKDTLQLLEG